MKKLFLLFTLCLFISSPAHAMTVQDLYVMCVGLTDHMKTSCNYYILGISEGGALEANVAGDKTHFCVPGGISADNLTLIVRTGMEGDLRAHPQDRNMPAVSFVGAVLTKAFPCR